MFTQAYDRKELIKVAIYTGRVTDDEYERTIVAAWEMTRDTQQRPDAVARIVLVVETDERPSAEVRRRIAEADAGMPRCEFAMVTRSVLARAAMTAIGWLSPERPGRSRRFFSTYEEARAWLVSGGVNERMLDILHAQARRQLSNEGPAPQR
jgi:hypothetical protein